MSNIWQAWLSGRTVRKHTMHVHRRENTAEHTWGILLLLEKYVPHAHPRVLKYAITHDSGEQAACDIPAHICWDYPQLKQVVETIEQEHVQQIMQHPHPPEQHQHQLLDDELAAVEIADRAEFILGCLYEFRMGNLLVLKGIARALSKMGDTLNLVPPSSPLHAGLQHLYIDVTREVKETDG